MQAATLTVLLAGATGCQQVTSASGISSSDRDRIANIAKRAVATNDTWADSATYKVERMGKGWEVTAWRIAGHDLLDGGYSKQEAFGSSTLKVMGTSQTTIAAIRLATIGLLAADEQNAHTRIPQIWLVLDIVLHMGGAHDNAAGGPDVKHRACTGPELSLPRFLHSFTCQAY